VSDQPERANVRFEPGMADELGLELLRLLDKPAPNAIGRKRRLAC
jgi:hypothetical protein